MKAIGGTSELDSAATAVRKALVGVRQICDELVDQNMDELKQNMDELKAHNRGKSLPNAISRLNAVLDAKQLGTELIETTEELTRKINGELLNIGHDT